MIAFIESLVVKHQGNGIAIHSPGTPKDIADFEKQGGFPLPHDFKDFYLTCNGFSCNEDIFNMISLSDIREYPKDFGDNWFYFAEYMMYSDMWGLRLTSSGQYEIFNGSYPDTALTSSLEEFLNVFLLGGVFEPGGLYDWQKKLGIK